MPRTSKNVRHTLLTQQNNQCRLCNSHVPDIRVARYDERLGYMLCARCNFLLTHVRNSQERGIGFEQIVAYENLEPCPQPIPTKLRRKLKPEQEAARQAVADGRVVDPLTGHVMTVEEFDARL